MAMLSLEGLRGLLHPEKPKTHSSTTRQQGVHRMTRRLFLATSAAGGLAATYVAAEKSGALDLVQKGVDKVDDLLHKDPPPEYPPAETIYPTTSHYTGVAEFEPEGANLRLALNLDPNSLIEWRFVERMEGLDFPKGTKSVRMKSPVFADGTVETSLGTTDLEKGKRWMKVRVFVDRPASNINPNRKPLKGNYEAFINYSKNTNLKLSDGEFRPGGIDENTQTSVTPRDVKFIPK